MSAAVLLLVLLAPTATPSPSPATLQLNAPQDRPTTLYQAPSTYREPGRPARNSVIITSQPVRVGPQQDSPAPSWRRQLFVRTSLGTDGATWMPSVHVTTSSTALGVGGPGAASAGTAGPPVVAAIDCADGRSCSTTIPVRGSPAQAPAFKPYSQEVLDKFLSDYATVTTTGNNNNAAAVSESQSEPGLTGEPTNRLANVYLEDPDTAANTTEEKSEKTQWSLLKAQRHKHPYDDNKGWVTLDPVPWSSSHVSKWQSNLQSNRPWDSRPSPSSWSNDLDQRPGPGPESGHTSPYPGHGPNSGYHHSQNTQNFNGNGDWPGSSHWDRPGPGPGPSPGHRPDRPSPSRPWDYQRPGPGSDPGPGPGPAPEQWVSSSDPDIITDNSPPDFPTHHPQRPSSSSASSSGGFGSHGYGPGPSRPWGGDRDRPHREPSRHPPTHPDEGDGTWVLLSSTKGYSTPPRGRMPHQRALTVSTHRSVRLTVLPPENGTNMTTSHGGLLEVEDTQHTVDESQRLHAAALLKQALDQHHNATLSSYETLVREAARVHEANLLRQTLAERNLANATAMSNGLVQLQPIEKRADNITATEKKGRVRQRQSGVFTGRGQGEGSAMAVKVVPPVAPSRRSMALAAVGAGLLPATMAMLVPIMLGRRRREAPATAPRPLIPRRRLLVT